LIGWHLTTEVLLVLTIFGLIAVAGRTGLGQGTAIGRLAGGIGALYWGHVYSNILTSGKLWHPVQD
jgi:hypothetical protein